MVSPAQVRLECSNRDWESGITSLAHQARRVSATRVHDRLSRMLLSKRTVTPRKACPRFVAVCIRSRKPRPSQTLTWFSRIHLLWEPDCRSITTTVSRLDTMLTKLIPVNFTRGPINFFVNRNNNRLTSLPRNLFLCQNWFQTLLTPMLPLRHRPWARSATVHLV